MTILHVTDLHFHQPWYTWLATAAPPHDLLVIAGDLLDLNHPASHQRQTDWVAEWVRAYDRPLSLCSGNHDLVWDSAHNVWWPARWLQSLAGPTTWVDGDAAEWRGVTLSHHGATGTTRAQPADIWVTHVPPLGPGVGWHHDGRAGGDPALLYSVRTYAPRLVLSGHVHRPLHWCDRFDGTLYFNPGMERAAKFPNYILIDLADGSARRVRDKGGQVEHDIVLGLAGLPSPLPPEFSPPPTGAARRQLVRETSPSLVS